MKIRSALSALDEFGIIEEPIIDPLWMGVSEMIETKSSEPRSRINKSFPKKDFSFKSLDRSALVKNKEMFSTRSRDSEKDNNPYKSPTVLSFDAYGNLTSSDDPDAPYSHEVPSLAEFDYILGTFEGTYKKEPNVTTIPSRNGTIKKNRKKKHNSGNNESISISDKDLKQVFKKDFDTTSASVTSRYGRTRKQKAQDGFVFGTINFNELRKITSPSPKKNRHSSSEGKSDSESSALEELHTNLSQNFEQLSDKIAGYSSEEEFVMKKKAPSKTKKHQQPSPAMNENFNDPQTISHKNNKKKGKGYANKNKNESAYNERRTTRSQGSIGDITHKDDLPPIPHVKEETDETEIKFNETALRLLNKESANLKQANKKSCYNTKKMEGKELGSIQEDVNIIKSSLADTKTANLKSNHDTHNASIKDNADSKGVGTNIPSKDNEDVIQKDIAKSPPTTIEIEPKIIEMETLNDEVKSEEATKTKFGRPVKKPLLTNITMDDDKKKKEVSETKQKQSDAPIKEVRFMIHFNNYSVMI